MIPFSANVLLWRIKNKLTQAQLARTARIPRPNLSDIERGKRDVSLKTVRALAYSLNTTPGKLVDGIPPEEYKPTISLTRESLERIAEGIALKKPITNNNEKYIAELVTSLISSKMDALQGSKKVRARRLSRNSDLSWLKLSQYPKESIKSLIDRTIAKLNRYE